MNFLAHFHLAWPDTLLITGALEGDFLKGRVPTTLSHGLATGIRLHRHIDAFTDQHQLIIQLKSRFHHPVRRYAGILIDICFDHYLCKHWTKFNSISLVKFNQIILQALEDHQNLLSKQALHMFFFLKRSNLLEAYQEWEQILQSIYLIEKKLRIENTFNKIDQTLASLDSELEHTFLNFYPKLIKRSDNFLIERRYNNGKITLS